MPEAGPSTAMEAEMLEAPRVLKALAQRLFARGADDPVGLGPEAWARLRQAPRVLWAACGSSRHAGILGKYACAQLAHLPSQVEQAHELGQFGPSLWQGVGLCIALSQSGETEDTLEAAALARAANCPVLAITNVPHSTLMQQSAYALDVAAGPERAVPATKSFLAQGLACLAVASAAARALGHASEKAFLLAQQARTLGDQVATLLAATGREGPQHVAMAEAVRLVAHARQAIFVGLGPAVAAAEEGALKLQEAAYVPARAFALGEIKHGPMAMLEPHKDVLVALVSPDEPKRNAIGIGRLAALGLPVVLIVGEGDAGGQGLAAAWPQATVLTTPAAMAVLWPLLASVVLQRLAHDVAAMRQTPVDSPRYLTKQITEI